MAHSLDDLRFKRIRDYTDEDLEFAIKYSAENCPAFYHYLRGIDAYFEKRRRKEEKQATAKTPPKGTP